MKFMFLLIALIDGLFPVWADLSVGSAVIDQTGRNAKLTEVKRQAEQGDVEAQNALGTLYYIGAGVQQDDVEATRWYRMAAEQGDADGQYALGNLYRDGEGVAQDYAEALRWYRLAAEQGNALARILHHSPQVSLYGL